jgi:hypothetical protein
MLYFYFAVLCVFLTPRPTSRNDPYPVVSGSPKQGRASATQQSRDRLSVAELHAAHRSRVARGSVQQGRDRPEFVLSG